jgi:hypothetical protein
MIFQKKSFSKKKKKKFLTGNVRNDNGARVGAKKNNKIETNLKNNFFNFLLKIKNKH